MNHSLLLLFCGCVLLLSCHTHKTPYITLDGQAQGTTFHIVYADSLHRDFSIPIDSLFRLIDRSMSLWDTSSAISRINRNDPTALLDSHFIKVFDAGVEVSELTNGAFDVTMGPLMHLWKIHSADLTQWPDSTAVDSVLMFTGYRKARRSDHQIIKKDPRLQLDFNAIAQGYTVDLICEYLSSKGITDYLVEIGGEVRSQGRNERGSAWHIGIDRPVDDSTGQRALQTTIMLEGKALATSGSYRKYQVREGMRLSHVIDPLTGYPMRQNLLSVSVIANDCMTADAFATAFLVLGMEKSLALAKENDLEIYGIYADENGQFQVVSTPGFGLE